MTGNKTTKFTFFKDARNESNSPHVQIQVALPEGVNVRITVEKTLADGKKLTEQSQVSTIQPTSAPEISQSRNDNPVLIPVLIKAKKTSPGWFKPSFQLLEKKKQLAWL